LFAELQDYSVKKYILYGRDFQTGASKFYKNTVSVSKPGAFFPN